MPSGGPNFSPYPIAALRRLTRADAAFETALARWLDARPLGARLAKLVGRRVRARVVGVCEGAFDPDAAHAEVRIGGASIVLAASAQAIRGLAQRLLGGPNELAAPRGLTTSEEAIWVLTVAAAVEDAGIAAEFWPSTGRPSSCVALEILVEGEATAWTVVAYVPRSLTVRVPPGRRDWSFDLPILVARCRIEAGAVARLAVRDVITVDREFSLVVGGGTVGLSAAPQAVEARVATGYVPAPMSHALADTAQLELTVQLGAARMTLRQLGELAPGAIVPLGRPLAGPFEVRAAGRLIGRGELIDVDGELGVRIVSLEE
ncbi:hypothetical protein BH11MYX3_BH11MYX3_36200 [soil metagenome]